MAIRLDKTKLVRNLAVKYKLVPHLDKAIGEGDFVWEYKYEPKATDDAWHPSGHCTPTPLELYQIATGTAEERPISPGLWKTFQVGHFWHQYLQWFIQKELGFSPRGAIERRGHKYWGDPRVMTDNEVIEQFKTQKGPIESWHPKNDDERWVIPSPFHWATGSADVAPCEIPGHGPYLIDFKSMGAHDFKRNDAPQWAVDKWECQVNIYMDWFGLDKALIIGILKDSPHDFKEFEFELNQPLVDAIYSKWKLVSACLDENLVPPEEEDIYLPLKGPLG